MIIVQYLITNHGKEKKVQNEMWWSSNNQESRNISIMLKDHLMTVDRIAMLRPMMLPEQK